MDMVVGMARKKKGALKTEREIYSNDEKWNRTKEKDSIFKKLELSAYIELKFI